MKNSGPFTTFGKEMTVIFPGTIGVTNWQGMSLNPKLGYLFVNTMNLGDVGRLEKQKPGPTHRMREPARGGRMRTSGTTISSGRASSLPGVSCGRSM
jgi:glucose dehydrogenase